MRTNDLEALTTSCKYRPPSLLNIHCNVRSSSVAWGRSVTGLSNQIWMPVIGECSNSSAVAPGNTSARSNGTALT